MLKPCGCERCETASAEVLEAIRALSVGENAKAIVILETKVARLRRNLPRRRNVKLRLVSQSPL